MRALPLAACLALAALGPGPRAGGWQQSPWSSWTTSLQADHPLVGKIWSTRKRRLVTPEEVAEALAAAPFGLLGEIHDNPDHHRLQAWALGAMVERGRRPAVVMEMIPEKKAGDLEAYLGGAVVTAEGLGKALDWAKSGWPPWEQYQPIGEAVLAGSLPLHWGNIDRKLARRVGKEGFQALGATRARALGLSEDLSPPLYQSLQQEIVEGHCNMLPAAATGPIAAAQRVKDAVFADQMLRHGAVRGAVLVAGGGHVRRDRAVPWYLERRAPRMPICVLYLREAEAGEEDMDHYLPRFPDGTPATDFLWITPAAEREDQCEVFRKHMAKKKGKASGE